MVFLWDTSPNLILFSEFNFSFWNESFNFSSSSLDWSHIVCSAFNSWNNFEQFEHLSAFLALTDDFDVWPTCSTDGDFTDFEIFFGFWFSFSVNNLLIIVSKFWIRSCVSIWLTSHFELFSGICRRTSIVSDPELGIHGFFANSEISDLLVWFVSSNDFPVIICFEKSPLPISRFTSFPYWSIPSIAIREGRFRWRRLLHPWTRDLQTAKFVLLFSDIWCV